MTPRFAFVAVALASVATSTLSVHLTCQGPPASVSTSQSHQGKSVVQMGALGGLRYEFTKFFVAPGTAVELILQNRDEMMHNLVITRPGAHMKVVMQAVQLGASAAKMDFIPKSAEVLWSIGVVKPGAAKTLRFTTPTTLGEYPYVCTYPGHGFVMFGTMVVHDGPPRPPVKSKLGDNVQALSSSTLGDSAPGADSRTTIKRMFMPAAGPASIAVSQPDKLSFCFDAGACRFRYAWAGGPILKVKLKVAPNLTGPVLCRETVGFPLRIGEDPTRPPKRVRFAGYRVDSAGVPEFEYRVDGIEVRERIVVHRDRLERRFHVSSTGKTLWFAFTGTAPKANRRGTLRAGSGTTPAFYGFETGPEPLLLTFSLNAGDGR